MIKFKAYLKLIVFSTFVLILVLVGIQSSTTRTVVADVSGGGTFDGGAGGGSGDSCDGCSPGDTGTI